MKKLLKVLLVIVPLIIIILIIALLVALNPIIAAAVEKVGSMATGTNVVIREVDISPFSGVGVIRGFTIGNPPEFKTENAFELGLVQVKLDLRSLLTDTIVIKEVIITAPEITYEQQLRTNNISQIRQNVNAFAGPPKEPEEPAPDEDKAPGKKMIIERFVITDAKINLSTTLLQGKSLSIPMKNIELTNLGAKPEGREQGSVKEVLDEIFRAVTGSVSDAVKASGAFLKQGGETLKGGLQGLQQNTEGLQDAGKGAMESLKGKGSGITEGVKDLFKRD